LLVFGTSRSELLWRSGVVGSIINGVNLRHECLALLHWLDFVLVPGPLAVLDCDGKLCSVQDLAAGILRLTALTGTGRGLLGRGARHLHVVSVAAGMGAMPP